MAKRIDLDAYLRRIGFAREACADLATLEALHARHPIAIPFENLATLMGHPVPLELEAVERKLVGEGRGGYCFEQNLLFAAALEALGFELESLAARVTWGREPGDVGARTHMVLLVRVDGEQYLCDVGFGGLTLTTPLRLEPGVPQAGTHEQFRIDRYGEREYELLVELEAHWRSMYRFDLQPQAPVDYEVLNHYVATHPESHFRSVLMAARRTPDGRHALVNGRVTRYEARFEAERREVETVEELRGVLEGVFNIALPDDPALDPALARALEQSSKAV